MPSIAIFGGPNGSGKSTLKEQMTEAQLGLYINPDDLSASIKRTGKIDLTSLGIEDISLESFIDFVRTHDLTIREADAWPKGFDPTFCRREKDDLIFNEGFIHTDYLASLLSDFIRQAWVARRYDFAFESVLSGSDKVRFVQAAQEAGYTITLFFVCTKSADINVRRVGYRVQKQGHPVPEALIRSRYMRTLEHLPAIMRYCQTVYLLDNSEKPPRAEGALVVKSEEGAGLTWFRPKAEAPSWVVTVLSEGGLL